MGRIETTAHQTATRNARHLLNALFCLLALLIYIPLSGCNSGGSVTTGKLSITAMSPGSVLTTGGQVAFSGTGFTPDVAVTFGGVAAQHVYYQSPALITATTPVVSAAATVDVVVSSASGGSVTLSQALSFTVPPPPVTTSSCTTLPCTYLAIAPANTLLGGAIVTACAGCPQGQKVGSLGYNSWVVYNNVYAPADGNYTLTIIGCEGAGSQNTKIIVNGNTAGATLVPESGNNWFAPDAPVSITVALKAGSANTIQYGNDTDYSPDAVSIQISAQGGGVAVPYILTSVSPTQLPLAGGQVTITGANFDSKAVVTFGGIAATNVSVTSSTQITATAAAVKSGGTVDVAAGPSASSSVTLPKALTFVQCQTLPCTYLAIDGENTLVNGAIVTTCSGCPQGMKVGSLGQGNDVIFNNVYAPAAGNYTLTITGCEGAGTQNYQVVVNGAAPIVVPLTGNNWDAPATPVTITVTLAAGGGNTIELGNATDYSPDAVSIATSAVNTATLPTITGVSPTQLPITGGQVTITGTNFDATTAVTFGGLSPVSPVTQLTATSFTVTAPASSVAGGVDVHVTSPGNGSVDKANGLTYVEPATCTSSTCVYQAWDPRNTIKSGSAASCVGCPYGLKLGSISGNTANAVTFNNVFAAADGMYNVTLVGCEGAGTQHYQVSANGGAVSTVPLYGNNWYMATSPVFTTVALKAGSSNTIQIGNATDYVPDLVYIIVSPANAITSPPAPHTVTIANGQNQVLYDLSTGLATYSNAGAAKITNFYSQAYNGTTLYQSTSSSYTRAATNGANGETDITLTATDGSPTMIQRFIMSANHFTVQLELDGTSLSSNQMSPVVVNGTGAVDLGAYADPRFLIVPFDNNAYYNYNSEVPSKISDTSYEVGAFYDNTSRNGIVIGSVTHDTWRSGIEFTGNSSVNKLDFLWAYGGANSTNDQRPHAAVLGATKLLSPVMMVGYYTDWRTGMEDYAATNATYAPMLAWNGPAPMGWNSWGKIQSNLSATNATAVENYFHTQLPQFNDKGVQYINLDNYWNNLTSAQLTTFVTQAHSQGQKVGVYWTPFIIWDWTDLTSTVDGITGYTFNDIVMKNPDGTPMGAVDQGWGADPTHPGTQARIDYYIKMFKTLGFDYIKLDFLSHGALEGGSNLGTFYDTKIQTGTQAYNEGMQRVLTDVGTSMVISESIAPLFPYQYAHTRRVAGDTYGSIEDTKREMDSESYGWWMAGNIYNWNDPDEMLLEGTETPSGSSTAVPFTANENKSRVTSGAVAGFMLNGDDVTDAGAPSLVQKWLTNTSINSLPALGLKFRPVEGNTGTSPVNVMIAVQNGITYLAIFNYDYTNPLSTSIDLGRAGLSSTTQYKVTDLWSGATSTATGTLSVSLGAAESTIIQLQ